MQLSVKSKKRKIYLTVQNSEILVHIPYRRALQMVEPRIDSSGDAVNVMEFTPREREVFDAVRRGLMNKEIGAELHISESTVKFHMGRVLSKIPGVRRRADIARKFGLNAVA